jgi:hypothetical protein
MAVHNRGTTP